jgi:hypothetical protein
MKKDNLIIFIIALLLLTGMLITIFFGGGRSRHGVGFLFDAQPKQEKPLTKTTTLDLCQSRAWNIQVWWPDERKQHIS